MHGQEELMGALKEICSGPSKGEEEPRRGVELHGMPGVGKTAVARELIKRERSRANRDKIVHFYYIATVGPNPQFDAILHDAFVALFPGEAPQYAAGGGCEGRFCKLQESQVLLVLDDVWKPQHIMRLNFATRGGLGHPNSRLIITTQVKGVLLLACPGATGATERTEAGVEQLCTQLRIKALPVGLPREAPKPQTEIPEQQTETSEEPKQMKEEKKRDEEERVAKKIFRFHAKLPESSTCDDADTVARACEGLPLAMCELGKLRHQLSPESENWKTIMQNIESADGILPDSLLKRLMRGYVELPPALKRCLLDFALRPPELFLEASELVQVGTSRSCC